MSTNKLTQGNIFKSLVGLALPIMATSFIQMAYNMTDMIWIGRLGSNAVAAVGTAGFFTWLGMAFILIPKIGAEVGVAQAVGRNDKKDARHYVRHTLQMIIVLSIVYGSGLILLRNQLIGFFDLGDAEVIDMSITYLVIIAFGIGFYFVNPVFTGIFNGYGDSKTPFIINSIGLAVNMILDPILINGIWIFPRLGVAGAAIATITAQFIVTIVFIYCIRRRMPLISQVKLLKAPDIPHLRRIIKLGFPVALQSGLFSIFAMIIAKIIAQWGPVPIAVQKVGSQIEAISWMTAGGFSTALSSFVGQNYGANKWNRIYRGYISGLKLVSLIGILATCLLVFGARPVFSLFIQEKEAIQYGIVYLQILGLSQLFMCIEIATTGAFNGLGKTVYPAIISILFTGLRVPAALILSSETVLGLNGVWWSISMSSVFKGVVLVGLFAIVLYKNKYLIKQDSLETVNR
ncbi:MATE family efflux transporter [Sporosalibacterium faouarense]|uniref:MATE family efflux transporter n=1 Tax=Sporosalibacterium faouarense TaxID=516123 RepID=UPI00192AF1F4|nr:MATE family efflux transporter [Sporosalibacterium faouarense]